MSGNVARDPFEDEFSIRLKPLCRVEAELALPLVLPNTPSGTRLIIEVLSLRLTGDRISATMKGRTAADWLTRSPDGRTGTLDVRCALETDDRALIFLQYGGRIRLASAGGETHQLYVAPRFDTGDERYAWLNRVQAVGKGVQVLGSQSIRYDFYEIE